jgi:hypothetical protein
VGEKEPTLASAVLLDQRTGQEFTATAGSTPSARLVARVRCPPEGDVRELGEGMTFSAGGSLYSVIKLERDPPTAVLERAQKSESPHRVVLAAKTAPAPGGASSPNATSLSAPSPATNSNELPKPTILLRRADLPGDGANQPGGS